MEGTTAGALIPEIVRRGFQGLLEAGVSSLTGAQLHERCTDQRSSHRNCYRRRLLTDPGVGPDPGHPQTEAGQLLPRLAGAPTPGRLGALRRGD
jgi:hypothetical protein